LIRDSFFARRLYSRRGFIRTAGVVGAGAAVAACTTTTETPTTAPAATAGAVASPTRAAGAAPAAAATAARAPKLGGVFNTFISSTEAQHFDIHQTNAAVLANFGAGMCWSQLLYFKNGPDLQMPNFTVEGDLAESWTQPDDATYLFKLRSGVKWQNIAPVNGRALVAQDIVYSYQRQIDQKVNAGFLKGMTKVEAVDNNTLRIQLDGPNADFLWSIASPLCKVIPHEVVEQKGDLKEGPIIGTGPWIFDKLDKGQILSLKKNPDYYIKGRPYLDGLGMYRIADNQALLNAFKTKALDAVQTNVTQSDAETLKKQFPDVVVKTGPGAVRFEMILKGDRPPFNDVRVRQAMSKAINRQEIIDTLLGVGSIESGLTVASRDQALPDAEIKQLLGYDLDGAKRLLQQAGVTNLDFEVQVGDYLGGLVVNAAELVKAQLAKAGLNAKLSVKDGTAWLNAVRVTGEFTCAFGIQSAIQPTSTELLTRHYSKGFQNTTGVSDPELDKMIDQQATLVKDAAGRAKLIQDIQRKFIGLYAFLPLPTQGAIYVYWPYLKDWNPNQGSANVNGDLNHVWLDK
jgi:ABC-type transport system substrate-binding protein